MAKSSFEDLETEEPAVETTALVDRKTLPEDEPTGELSIPSEEGLSGEFGREDVEIPRLNIVAKTSQLVDEGFTPGSIVLNKQVPLVLKETDLRVFVVSCRKQYQEDVPWGEDRLGRIFNTRQELEAEGFSTEWGSPNLCVPLATIVLLVEAPKGLSEEALELFPFEHKDKNYTMAVLTASKTAYKTTAKPIASYLAFAKKGSSLTDIAWSLKSVLKTNGDNSWFSPVLTRGSSVDEEMRAFIKSITH